MFCNMQMHLKHNFIINIVGIHKRKTSLKKDNLEIQGSNIKNKMNGIAQLATFFI